MAAKQNVDCREKESERWRRERVVGSKSSKLGIKLWVDAYIYFSISLYRS